MDMNLQINRLLNFALQQGLIAPEDKYYSANLLLDLLGVDEFEVIEVDETLPIAHDILENMLDYAVEKGLCEDTVTQRDLFDTRIMNCVMPRPSEVVGNFKKLYEKSKVQATDYFYKTSIASNYIRKDRIDKNIIWKANTEYGDLDITINLSKPEKDPRDIAKAKLVKSSSYPKCLLCRENEGYAGHANHPARQTHRLIPMDFEGHQWFMQYSPYTYYNEHCILLNSLHVPMKVCRATFENLLNFVDYLPHYFLGSNADLPIVGGSILSHDHYQGGHYTFAMEKAPIEETFNIEGFDNVTVGRVKWPMSVIRAASSNKQDLINFAVHVLDAWRGYSDASVDILAESDGQPHNTITPIARVRDGKYELDLVLRNNRTTEEYPLGIFHPHEEVHHIKKENIGLIEVMGLAVLPARLKDELAKVKECFIAGKEDISDDEQIAKHADWYKEIRAKYTDIKAEEVEDMLKLEVGKIFMVVLLHAGVFKRNIQGIQAFNKFVATL